MKVPAIFLPKAEAQLLELFEQYWAIRPELADKFRKSVEKKVSMISDYPDIGTRIFRKSRRFSLTDFPYHIYYSVKPGHIVIWAINHASRDLKPLRKEEKKV